MTNQDIKGMTDQELHDKIREERAALSKMMLNHGISPVENPAKLRENRRMIARMQTEVTSRKKSSK